MYRLQSLKAVGKIALSQGKKVNAGVKINNITFGTVTAPRFVISRSFSTEKEIIQVLPPLGDSVTSGVIKTWKVKVGDRVSVDQVVAVVETDKVTVELRSAHNGVVAKLAGEEGLELLIGQEFIRYSEGGAATGIPPRPAIASTPAAAEKPSASPASPASKPSGPVSVSTALFKSNADSVTSGTIAKWHKNVGDHVNVDEIIVTVATDKTMADFRAAEAGKLVKKYAEIDVELQINMPLYDIAVGDLSGNKGTNAVAPPASSAAGSASSGMKTVVPAAAPQASKPAAAPAPAPASSAPAPAGSRTEKREKMSKMRQRIAQRLKDSQNTAALLTTFQECDMSNLIDMRNKYKDDFEKVHKVKLGFMSAFVKASTSALQEIKAVNAVIDDNTKEIIYRNYVDISVAVASPTGLVVPVLRNTEQMSFADVEKAIFNYGQKAKDGTLALEDMLGGTFTISNGGVFGSLYGTPIVNPPQSAILGMHATKMRPVVVTNPTTKVHTIEARPMMYLALTYDHRLIDGREAVLFLKSIANKIEDPSRLILGV